MLSPLYLHLNSNLLQSHFLRIFLTGVHETTYRPPTINILAVISPIEPHEHWHWPIRMLHSDPFRCPFGPSIRASHWSQMKNGLAVSSFNPTVLLLYFCFWFVVFPLLEFCGLPNRYPNGELNVNNPLSSGGWYSAATHMHKQLVSND